MMKMVDEPKWTPGPWRAFIDDSGGQWTGWPLSIDAVNITDKMIVRTGGQWPYEWDAATSQSEAVANAHLIAAAPDMAEALKAAIAISDRNVGDGGRTDECQQVYDQCAAALAKARGEA